MKNILYLLSFLFVFSLNAQKNKNGNLYDKHPGIDLVASFHEAYAKGDLDKASEILHDTNDINQIPIKVKLNTKIGTFIMKLKKIVQ